MSTGGAAPTATTRLTNNMILLQDFYVTAVPQMDSQMSKHPVRIKAPVALKHQSDSNFRSSAKYFDGAAWHIVLFERAREN